MEVALKHVRLLAREHVCYHARTVMVELATTRIAGASVNGAESLRLCDV